MSRHVIQSCRANSASRNVPVLRPLCAAMAVAFTLASGMAWAQLPSGVQVVNGSASIVSNGPAMAISNSPNTILDWQSFSIGASNSVHFQQESASSQVLNRVVGQDPSLLLGSLSSNGRVWLINPHGVLFGPGARVDVAGLVASTLTVSNADFLAGRGVFGGNTDIAGTQLLNQGQISTAFGGRVWLIGDSVRNEGLIQTPGGQILLAAGKSIELVDSATPNLVVRLTAPVNEVLNLGRLIATGPGSSIDLHGGIVNQQGIIRADSAGVDAAGRVVLRALGDIELSDGSHTSASAAGSGTGGQVSIDSTTGTTLVSGDVSAASAHGQGGQVQLLGDRVGLYRQATVDASGASGGGTVMVGGDYQGQNPLLHNAQASYVGSEVKLRADATAHGDGGKVIVWSDGATRVYGSLSAQGGADGGDGGLIETSGKTLATTGARVSAGAANGAPGEWLLDPANVQIVHYGGEGAISPEGDPATGITFTSSSDFGAVYDADISAALTAGANVTVSTGANGSGTDFPDGDLLVHPDVEITHAGNVPVRLTLSAHRNIDFVVPYDAPGARIEAKKLGSLSLDLNADQDKNDNIQQGYVHIDGATINTRGGQLRIFGQSDPVSGFAKGGVESDGVSIHNSTINAADVSIRGQAGEYAAAARIDRSVLDSTSSLTIIGEGSSDSAYSDGIIVSGSTLSADGRLWLSTTNFGGYGVGFRVEGGGQGEQSVIESRNGTVDIFAESGELGFEARNTLISGRSVLLKGVADGAAIDGAGPGLVLAPDVTLNASYIAVVGDSTSTSAPGLDLAGAVLNSTGDIILLAKNGGSVDSIKLHHQAVEAGQTSSTIYASDNLIIAPGGIDIDDPSAYQVPISVSASSGSGFLLEPADLASIKSGTGSVIIGSDRHVGGITVSDGLQMTSNLTLQNQGAGSAGITFSGIDVGAHTLALATSGPLVQGSGGSLLADSLLLLTDSTVSMGSANRINRLSVGGNNYGPEDFSFENQGSLVLGPVSSKGFVQGSGSQDLAAQNSSSLGDFYVRAHAVDSSNPGNLLLQQNVRTYGSDITLVAGNNFSSFGGSLSPAKGGRWLVYDVDGPANTSQSGLDYDFTQFSASFPFEPPKSQGSGTLYATSLEFTAKGRISKVYDAKPDADLSSASFAGIPSGYQISLDSNKGVFLDSSGETPDKNVGASKPVDADGGVTLLDALNGKPVYGHDGIVSFMGDITKAPLTITALANSKVYDGNTSAATMPRVDGLIGEDKIIGLRQAYTDSNVGLGKTLFVQPSYQISDGNYGGNYEVKQVDSNQGEILAIPFEFNSSIEEAVRLAQPPMDAFPAAGLIDFSVLDRNQLFAPINIGAMNQRELAGLLELRNEFKRQLFADSINKLEIDPSLADVKSCISVEEAGTGMCRITPELIADIQARAAQAQPVQQTAAPHQPALPLIQRKIALLFGINEYGDRRIPKLESAIPDVVAVSRVLTERMGYEVRVLRNPGKADIIRSLNQVSMEAKPADSVLIYYAGHGYSLEKHGAGYWIPADAPVDDPSRWLSNADISRLLAGYQPRQTALVSDSCYSGAFAREALDGLGSQIDAKDVLSKRSVVVLSSGGDEPVTDEGKEGHSIFAWNFMQSINALQGWAPGNSIFRQVQAAVKKEFPQTPQYGAVSAAGHEPGGEYLFEVR